MTHILLLHEVLAAATRVVSGPPAYKACRVSVDERVSMAVLVLQQHEMIVAAGLAYPRVEDAEPTRQLEAAE